MIVVVMVVDVVLVSVLVADELVVVSVVVVVDDVVDDVVVGAPDTACRGGESTEIVSCVKMWNKCNKHPPTHTETGHKWLLRAGGALIRGGREVSRCTWKTYDVGANKYERTIKTSYVFSTKARVFPPQKLQSVYCSARLHDTYPSGDT